MKIEKIIAKSQHFDAKRLKAADKAEAKAERRNEKTEAPDAAAGEAATLPAAANPIGGVPAAAPGVPAAGAIGPEVRVSEQAAPPITPPAVAASKAPASPKVDAAAADPGRPGAGAQKVAGGAINGVSRMPDAVRAMVIELTSRRDREEAAADAALDRVAQLPLPAGDATSAGATSRALLPAPAPPELAAVTKSQMIVEAAASLVAQANQTEAGVLSLLRAIDFSQSKAGPETESRPVRTPVAQSPVRDVAA